MPLNEKTGATMKLTAFDLDEVEEVEPGVFRHRRSLRAVVARLHARWDALRRRPASDERFRRPPNNWA